MKSKYYTLVFLSHPICRPIRFFITNSIIFNVS